jgi:Flp pilus assembly protein TadB
MVEYLLLATAVAMRVDLRMVALMAIAVFAPFIGLVGVVGHIYLSRPRRDTRAAVFCQSMARELRAGESLRSALESSGDLVLAGRLTSAIESGDTLDRLSPILRSEFPEIGIELATVVRSVAGSGGSSASLFDELGDLALAQIEIAEEIRVGTSPARSSAAVLIGLPVVYLTFQVGTGRLQDLLTRPLQQGLATVGIALVLVGTTVSLWLVRRAK